MLRLSDMGSSRIHFQSEMQDLRLRIVEMGSLALNQIERASAAWENADTAAAEQVIADDERIDETCAELDHQIYRLQLLQAPVAGDLRLLHVGLITIVALERVGDLAVAIAELTRAVRPGDANPEIQATLSRMSAQAIDTLALAVQAIARGDAQLGERAAAQAQAVRDMLAELPDIVAAADAHSASASWGAAAVLVARHLERVANNGGELGRRVDFMVTGEPYRRSPAAAASGD
jgi:phosphate transport system protein